MEDNVMTRVVHTTGFLRLAVFSTKIAPNFCDAIRNNSKGEGYDVDKARLGLAIPTSLWYGKGTALSKLKVEAIY